MKIYGYVYLIIDHWNNHVYVGQKKGLPEDSLDYFGSGKLISYIVQKRRHLLSKRIIGYCYTFKELNEAEKICIEFYKSNNRLYGYNLTNGGQGITGLFGNKNPMYGKNYQSHGIIEYAKNNLGKTIDEIHGKTKAKEIRKKISNANKGKQRTQKAKENYRQANIGTKNPMFIQLPQKQINLILKEFKLNKYANIISKKTKISLHLVKRVLKENNLQISILPQNQQVKGKNNGRFITLSLLEQKNILKLYHNGLTMKKISQINKISIFKIKQVLRQNNIQIQHSRVCK